MYPNEIPSRFSCGDTVQFATRAYDPFGNELTYAGGYSLYLILNNTSHVYSATSIATCDQGYLVTVPSSATTGWTAGSYNAAVYAVSSANRYPVMSKQVTLQANLFTSSGFDSRSTTKQILDAIDATILGSATAGQLSMSVAGRSIQRMSLDELINAKSKFESLVAAEKSSADVAAGKPSRNTIQVRFK
jgi:hypothetical protein